MTTKPHTEETRVKERLNLFYHGLRECEKPTMFREVREWLCEMDDAETESLHSIICGVVYRHCKDVQLPSGIIGLENDLIEALISRLTPATAAPVVDDTELTRVHKRLVEHGEHISLIDGILGGINPLVSATRIGVHHILTCLYNGNSIEHIAENYQLSPEAIKDAIAFAQDVYDDAIDSALHKPAAATAAPVEQQPLPPLPTLYAMFEEWRTSFPEGKQPESDAPQTEQLIDAWIAGFAKHNEITCAASVGQSDDEWVAWLRYDFTNEETTGTTINVCDSDAEGAFKVYRAPQLPSPTSASAAAEEINRDLESIRKRVKDFHAGYERPIIVKDLERLLQICDHLLDTNRRE